MWKQYTHCIWSYVRCENSTPIVSCAVSDVKIVHSFYLELFAMWKQKKNNCILGYMVCINKTPLYLELYSTWKQYIHSIWCYMYIHCICSYMRCVNSTSTVSVAICDVKKYTNGMSRYVRCENSTQTVSGAMCDVKTIHPMCLEIYAMY